MAWKGHLNTKRWIRKAPKPLLLRRSWLQQIHSKVQARYFCVCVYLKLWIELKTPTKCFGTYLLEAFLTFLACWSVLNRNSWVHARARSSIKNILRTKVLKKRFNQSEISRLMDLSQKVLRSCGSADRHCATCTQGFALALALLLLSFLRHYYPGFCKLHRQKSVRNSTETNLPPLSSKFGRVKGCSSRALKISGISVVIFLVLKK